MLWLIFAFMSAAAVLSVLWPLLRKQRAVRAGSDIFVYRDQLEEIDRDRTGGLIGEAEAEAARIEISRRLLAAADARAPSPPAPPLWHRRAGAVAALIVLLLVPASLYVVLGSPNIPGQPAFSRLAMPLNHETIVSLVGRVEEHLTHNPNDGAGWDVIAPVYMRMGRYNDAVAAWRKSLALNGETAARDSNFGEALVAAANGVVTDEAKQTFESAIARDAHEPKARYFLGVADEQDGNRASAVAEWRALLQDAPPDAPWISFVRAALAHATAKPSVAEGPNAADLAAAENMPEAQRGAMIRGMVVRLAEQLHADGRNVNGWLRLVRAYVVLGERGKAKGAAAEAKHALADRPDEIKRIDDLVKGLGLAG